MTDSKITKTLLSVAELFLSKLPTELQEETRAGMYFAGGCIVDLVLGLVPNDYDIFFKSEELALKVKGAFEESGDYKANTTNAVTLILDSGWEKLDVQAITRFAGPPERVFKDFDYEHCKTFYDLATDRLHYNADVISNKKLIYTGEKDKYSLNTLKRLVKFTNRGWKVDNQSLINLHKACAKNDLDDPEVMRELAAGFYGSSFV